jgi:signal transduction histidine kinase
LPRIGAPMPPQQDALRPDSATPNDPRGIPSEKLEKIFEPFVRVDTGYSRRTEGTGLGLAIGRDLARAMGGEISVPSTPGKGSIFTLTLPRRKRAEDVRAETSARAR